MRPSLPIDGAVRWGYATNHWKPGFMGFARREEHERAFKVTAACGFSAIELTAGSGRWEPLGRPESIALNYGSLAGFRSMLAEWGISAVASIYYDPGQMSFDDLHHGLSPLDEAQHAEILRIASLHLDSLAALGGHCLVVRPAPSHWQTGEPDAAALDRVARCWAAVAGAAQERGLVVGLHVDSLSALRSLAAIESLLERLPGKAVGLAIDTAELAIAGHDVVALYRRLHRRVVHFQFKDAMARDELGEYRVPNAERVLIQAGGERRVARWFGELGTGPGLVDFPGLASAICELGYRGWIIVESDRGPAPVAAGMMTNAWYVQRVLAPIMAGLTPALP
jgi:inosose dehydratase